MGTEPESVHVRNCRAFARAASSLAMLMGIFVLIGWWLKIPVLISVLPGLATMKPITAICFVLAGIALRLFIHQDFSSTSRAAMVVGRCCAALVLLAGAATLAEYLLGWNFGIDELLFRSALLATHIPHPGRVAAASATAFLLLGGALLLGDWKILGKYRPANFLALATALIGLIAFLGYAYSVKILYGVFAYSSMALHTAVLFMLLGMGLVLARPRAGLMAVITSDYLGGAMARRLIPLVITIPMVLGWLRLKGQEAGWYGTEFGTAIFASSNVLILALIVWIKARRLNRLDAARRRAEDRDLHLAAIVESSEDAIISKTLEGIITSWNKGAERLYGYHEDEVLGQPIVLLAPPDRRDEAPALLEEVRHGGAVIRHETVRRRKDGTLLNISLTISPVRDRQGMIVGASVVGRDITEQKRAEEAIRLSQTQLKAALEAGRMGTWVWDIAHKQSVWDEAVTRLFGQDLRALGDDPVEAFFSIVHPQDRERVRAALEASLREGENYEVDYRVIHPDGAVLWVGSRGRLERDLQGVPLRMVGVCADIHARKQMESSMLQSQKVQALGTLAGGIAHDFNNIMLAIGGNTRLAMQDLPADHPAYSSLQEIAKAGGRATALVRQILTLSHHQETNHKVLELRPAVEEALALLRSALPANIEIHTSFEEQAPQVSADFTQVQQAIMNLGTNAARALGNAGGVIEVAVNAITVGTNFTGRAIKLKEGPYLRLTFSDNGCGMDEATMARIFEPFFTTQAHGEGAGLGLAMVDGIMRSHGGSVTVYSELGKGSVFSLYFPVIEQKKELAGATAVLSPRGQGQRLMYVDDEQALVRLVTHALQRLGYQVTGFSDPRKALEVFREQSQQFDAIITDIAMPHLSGPDLAAKLAAIRPEVPIVMTSGYIRPQDQEAAQRLGIRELILKPDTVDDLALALDRVFGGERQ